MLSSKTVLNSQLGRTCKFRYGLTRVIPCRVRLPFQLNHRFNIVADLLLTSSRINKCNLTNKRADASEEKHTYKRTNEHTNDLTEETPMVVVQTNPLFSVPQIDYSKIASGEAKETLIQVRNLQSTSRLLKVKVV